MKCKISARCWGALVLIFALVRAHGAEFFYMDHDLMTARYVGPVGPLVISGEFEPGDYEHLLAKIRSDPPRFTAQNTVILASRGGDVGEAIKIARFVQALYARVSVGPQTGPCIGACFLIYAAAVQRTTDGEHLIGLHRPALVESLAQSLSPADATALEERALTQVREFLAANEVPHDLLDTMFARTAADVYWLTTSDEKAIGDKSHAFQRLLAAQCGWSDTLERDVYAGKRRLDELTAMLACRERTTRPLAHKALTDALNPKAAAR